MLVMPKVVIDIPEDILARIPEKDLEKVIKVELAVALYKEGYLSLGQARRIAGMSKIEFIDELAKRGVERHYTEEDLEDDIKFGRE